MNKKNGKSVLDSVKKEDLIQAVVIADSYNDNLSPAYSIPCLMPLVNRPLLDYTLECLSSAHVQEVILFCTSHADQLKDFIKQRSWGRLSVTIVVSDGCRSLGDAMRDLDSKALIRGDFILVTGKLVGNLKLLPILERHKKLQKTDKGIAMTLVYKECGRKSRTEEDELYLGIDQKTDRVLIHQRGFTDNKKINIGVDVLLEHETVALRYDLMDTRVSICSLSVPPLFSDNFDFQTRDDFVRGLLMNEEILASTVYSYVLPPSEYAATVTCWQNYHSVSHDIIHRWTFPSVPDMNIDECYRFKIKNIYLHDNVTLSKGSTLVEDIVIGEGTEVGENTTLQCTIIGKHCKIGNKAVITSSHLFNKVNIESGCKIDFCVIGEGCIIRSGAKLSCCVIGPGVVIGKDKIVENIRLQSQPPQGEDGKENFGPKAFAYRGGEEDEEADSDSEGEVCQVTRRYYGLRLETQEEDSDESISDTEEHLSDKEFLFQEDTNVFYSEVVDSLVRGYEDKLPCDNLVLEVNSSRYAYNVTVNEVNYYVVKAILSLQADFSWEAVAAKLKYFMPLIVNYLRNEAAMLDCLNAIEDVAETNPVFQPICMKLIHLLYNKDILSEESILKWFSEPREDNEDSRKLRKLIQPFIEWLQTADDEDSDED